MKKAHLASAGELFADRYLIGRLLGEGGMGRVYLAQDTLLGNETVALKFLETDPENEQKQSCGFLLAVQLARRVTHPNVVRTFDAGKFGPQVFSSMEYAPGVTLRSVLERSGRMHPGEVVFVLRQVTAGLQAIHAAGIVHGDLKSCNVIMNPEGLVKIADFGIARSKVSRSDEADEILGSWPYLSPEIWTGHESTPLSDIYALGVLTYELLSGDLPFDSQSSSEMMRCHLEETPSPLSSKFPDIPFWLESLTLSMLEKNPEKRPLTVQAVGALLKETVDAGEIEVPFSLPGESVALTPRKLPSISYPADTASVQMTDPTKLKDVTAVEGAPQRISIGSFCRGTIRSILMTGLGILLLGLCLRGPGIWIQQLWHNDTVLVSPSAFIVAFLTVMLYSIALSCAPISLLALMVLTPWRSLIVFSKMFLIQALLWMGLYCAGVVKTFMSGTSAQIEISFNALASYLRPASEIVLTNSFLILKDGLGRYAAALAFKPEDAVETSSLYASPAGLLALCVYVFCGFAILRKELSPSGSGRFCASVEHAGAFLMLGYLVNVIVAAVVPASAESLLNKVLYMPIGPFTIPVSMDSIFSALLCWIVAVVVLATFVLRSRSEVHKYGDSLNK